MTWKLCLAFAAAATAAAANAQSYPQGPITIVVPFAAGSSSDAAARIYAKALYEEVKKPVIVDNRPGADAMIGALAVARAAADGRTLLFGSGTANAVNYALYAKTIRYKPESFDVISIVQSNPGVLFAAKSRRLSTLEEVIAATTTSGTGSCGSGNAVGRIACLTFIARINAQSKIVNVPFKGTSPALTDLGAGRIDIAFTDIGVGSTFVANGLVTPIAVAADKRLETLPAVPTFEELGFARFVFTSWSGLFAPAGTPKPVIQRLNEVARQMMATADWQKRRQAVSGIALTGDLAGSQAFVAEQIALWHDYIRDSGISAQ